MDRTVAFSAVPVCSDPKLLAGPSAPRVVQSMYQRWKYQVPIPQCIDIALQGVRHYLDHRFGHAIGLWLETEHSYVLDAKEVRKG